MDKGTRREAWCTWNPITGCSRISTGCENCYAERLAGTRMKNEPSRKGLTRETERGPVWNGTVRFNDKWWWQPMNWRKPRRIFVVAHGDLFHENVPEQRLNEVFAMMMLAPWHTYQVLTKRSSRMRYYVNRMESEDAGYEDVTDAAERTGIGQTGLDLIENTPWPIPQIHFGVSVEDQDADPRIVDLLNTAAAVRWISAEPLLGSLNVSPLLDWVVVGGESGPGARPMNPDWARSLRDQCVAASVPFFFKQWGEWLPCEELPPPYEPFDFPRRFLALDGSHTAHPTWPSDQEMIRVGKKRAGRMLDGRTWDEMPALQGSMKMRRPPWDEQGGRLVRRGAGPAAPALKEQHRDYQTVYALTSPPDSHSFDSPLPTHPEARKVAQNRFWREIRGVSDAIPKRPLQFFDEDRGEQVLVDRNVPNT